MAMHFSDQRHLRLWIGYIHALGLGSFWISDPAGLWFTVDRQVGNKLVSFLAMNFVGIASAINEHIF